MNTAKPVLAFGAANAERIIEVPSLTPGSKTVVAPATMSAGGSAVNHVCRLLAAGIPAWPVIPIGDDHGGELVRDVINAATAGGSITADEYHLLVQWLQPLRQPNRTTGFTTIIVERNGQRTVFSETATASGEFRDVCDAVLSRTAPENIGGVLIGHIHADTSPTASVPSGCSGAITSMLISHFAGRVPVVANLGRSQHGLGARRWLPDLEKIDIFQATFEEAVEFIAADGTSCESLRDVARWFNENHVTAVITIDRFGALGVLKDDRRVVLAWPYDLGGDLVDATGAGDAMAAGLMAALRNRGPNASLDALSLRDALDSATVWAAFACTTLGGSRDCPSFDDLKLFARRKEPFRNVEVAPLDDDRTRTFLHQFERAHPPSYHQGYF